MRYVPSTLKGMARFTDMQLYQGAFVFPLSSKSFFFFAEKLTFGCVRNSGENLCVTTFLRKCQFHWFFSGTCDRPFDLSALIRFRSPPQIDALPSLTSRAPPFRTILCLKPMPVCLDLGLPENFPSPQAIFSRHASPSSSSFGFFSMSAPLVRRSASGRILPPSAFFPRRFLSYEHRPVRPSCRF